MQAVTEDVPRARPLGTGDPIERLLLDTDVVSYLFRGDTRSERYRRRLSGCRLALSFMSIAELDRWVRERSWGRTRRESLQHYLRSFTVYLVDRRLCSVWAAASIRRSGHSGRSGRSGRSSRLQPAPTAT
jgi:predicted nucleic acid-binding protein